MKIYVAIILSSLALAALGDPDDDHWEAFKAKFNKEYSPKEEALRKVEFIKTQRAIEKHNNENKSWKAEHNKFSDLTVEERKSVLGLNSAGRNRTNSGKGSRSLETLDRVLPSSFDHRSSGCIQPVKNQGGCGSCWAFAAVTPVEYALCMRNNNPVSLSEQQIVSCTLSAWGCSGGGNELAWDYLKTKGIATACAYPYVSGKSGQNEICLFQDSMSTVKVAYYDWADLYLPVNPDVMAESLIKYGPLGTGMAVINSFYSYSSGVYDDAACNLVGANHAVVIVGYGVTPDGIPYWIVRNSWGLGWGIRGYFLIRKGVDRCHIEYWAQYVAIV